MASKNITPFANDIKDDAVQTLLYIQNLKDMEAEIKAKRQEAENWLAEALELDGNREGTFNFGDENNFVTFEIKRDYQVDDAKLQELVEQGQISTQTVEKVIRWQPKLNVTPWKQDIGDEERSILAQAITSKTGKPSVKVFASENKEN